GRIHYQGIKFGYQQQQIYWQAIGRYLNSKIHEVFKRWDSDTKQYPLPVRLSSIDGVERYLRQFFTKILAHGVDTDIRLRGAGFPDRVKPFDASAIQGRALAETSQLAQSHRGLLIDQPTTIESERRLVRLGKAIEDFYTNHKGLIWLAGIAAS